MKKSHIAQAVVWLLAGGMPALSVQAFAQDKQELERVTVTGSSFKRLAAHTSLPFTVDTSTPIEKRLAL